MINGTIAPHSLFSTSFCKGRIPAFLLPMDKWTHLFNAFWASLFKLIRLRLQKLLKEKVWRGKSAAERQSAIYWPCNQTSPWQTCQWGWQRREISSIKQCVIFIYKLHWKLFQSFPCKMIHSSMLDLWTFSERECIVWGCRILSEDISHSSANFTKSLWSNSFWVMKIFWRKSGMKPKWSLQVKKMTRNCHPV